MTVLPVGYPGYEQWQFPGGAVLAHHSVLAPVREALEASRDLYAWAARQEGRDTFTGRGEAYGIRLGDVRAVVRHARRGGALASLLQDRYLGRPRFVRELDLADRLRRAGVPTPQVLAGVLYPRGLFHRADVATERVDAIDLVSLFWGQAPPRAELRTTILQAVGALVRKLHAAGFVHPDLQLRNLLVAARRASGPPVRPSAWIIDVDTCRVIAPSDEAARNANLARLERSMDKWNAMKGPRLTDDDLAAFMNGYHEKPA